MTAFVITDAFVVPAPAGGDGVKTLIGYGTGPTTYEVGGSPIDLTSYFRGTIDNVIMTSPVADLDWKFTAGTNYAVRARGTITLTGIPTADQSFVINATTITAKADGSGSVDYFTIGTAAADTVTNIVKTLNECSECANISAWDGAGNTVVIEWTACGATAGTAITFTETLGNATIDGSGTLIGPMLMGTSGGGAEEGAGDLSSVTNFVAYGRDTAVL